MSPLHKSALLVAVAVASLGILGCPWGIGCSGGRWEHYASGGSFGGGHPSMSPDGSSIVYASPRTGHGDIYAVGRDGSNTQRLTDDPECECDPAFSPDGSKIAFVREQDGVGHVWIMNADASGQRQLTEDRGDDNTPAFSPDGSRIIFMRYVRDWKFRPGTAASIEIYVVNVDGTNETRLTDNTCQDWPASFSPDGKRIVFGRDGPSHTEIWVIDADGSNPCRLGRGSSPSFSPDGKRIVFIDDRNTPFAYDMYMMDADGGKVSQITTDGGYKSGLSFCLDGKALLYHDEEGRGGGKLRLLYLEDRSFEEIASTK